MEEETFGIPICDPNKIDELLGNKLSKDAIFNSIEYPKCKNCEKEFYRFFWKKTSIRL